MTNEKLPERVWLTVFTDDKEPHFTMLEWQSPVVRNTQPGDYVAIRPHHKIEYVPASAAPVVGEDRLAQTLQAEAELAAEHPHDGYDCGGTCAFHNPALRFPAAAATAAPVEQSATETAKQIVGTIFDNTGASHETLK